ncbi:MAG: fibrobacter succinogenes major paralogous domain-containing protein [Prevotellaceae bacterium]|nr:fibrobacter succinogenes major paralogous domain-containing protein [Prevotellaceae bacterium]
MKKQFFSFTGACFVACLFLCGGGGVAAAQTVPPHAVSAKTWSIEGHGVAQTWSDHINMPACDKAEFNSGTRHEPQPDCRNNPGYYFLYNWYYVNDYASSLCPAPWRVPGRDDFISLNRALGGTTDGSSNETMAARYAADWGAAYGGLASSDGFSYLGIYGYYWSISEGFAGNSYYLYLSSSNVYSYSHFYKSFGLALRCVM